MQAGACRTPPQWTRRLRLPNFTSHSTSAAGRSDKQLVVHGRRGRRRRRWLLSRWISLRRLLGRVHPASEDAGCETKDSPLNADRVRKGVKYSAWAWPVDRLLSGGGSDLPAVGSLAALASSSLSLSLSIFLSLYLSLCLYLPIYLSLDLSIPFPSSPPATLRSSCPAGNPPPHRADPLTCHRPMNGQAFITLRIDARCKPTSLRTSGISCNGSGSQRREQVAAFIQLLPRTDPGSSGASAVRTEPKSRPTHGEIHPI